MHDTQVPLPNLIFSLPSGKFASLEGRSVFLFEFPTTICASPHPTPSPYPDHFIGTVCFSSSYRKPMVCPLLQSIIYTSFKCMSLQPSVTPSHLPGRLSEVGVLLSSPQILHHSSGPPDHQASIPTPSLPAEGAVDLPVPVPSLPFLKPSHPRNICQGLANSHFFICWGKSHLCI